MSHQGTIRRYTLIIEKLKSLQHPSMKGILEYLENMGLKTSQRTTERDIEAIRNDFGLEITFNHERGGYYIDFDNSINVESFFRFLEIVNTAELLTESLSESKEALNHISFDTGGGLKGIEQLKPLLRAIKENRVISFGHFNFHTEKSKHYTIQPYLLKEYQNRWYIIGVPIGTNELRTFGIDRTQDLNIKAETFTPDKNITPLENFENTIGLVYSFRKQQKVVLSFTPNQGRYIKSLRWHKSQNVIIDNDKECRIELDIIPNYELTQKILMHADTVTVLEPDWLVEEIKTFLKSTLDKYK